MSGMTDFDRANVGVILTDPKNDWFTARLLRLIYQADAGVRDQLRRGYPDEVEAVERYEGEQKKSLADLREELELLVVKADPGNRASLIDCFPAEIAYMMRGEGHGE